jgi:hypothetical protein
MRQWSQNLFQVMNRFNSGDMIITFDKTFTDGVEDPDRLEEFLTRNKSGQVIGVSFPKRLIMIANHQVIKRDLQKVCVCGEGCGHITFKSNFFLYSCFFFYRFTQTGFIFGLLLIYQKPMVH